MLTYLAEFGLNSGLVIYIWTLSMRAAKALETCLRLYCLTYTGQPPYVKLAYLEYMGYVEVIVHSRIFPLYCIVFRPCLCQTRLSWKLGYIEAIFHSRNSCFSLFTTACIEVVKKWNGPNDKQSNFPDWSNNSLNFSLINPLLRVIAN